MRRSIRQIYMRLNELHRFLNSDLTREARRAYEQEKRALYRELAQHKAQQQRGGRGEHEPYPMRRVAARPVCGGGGVGQRCAARAGRVRDGGMARRCGGFAGALSAAGGAEPPKKDERMPQTSASRAVGRNSDRPAA